MVRGSGVVTGGSGRRNTLPGFGLTMGLTLTWLSVIILIPLAGLFLKTFELSFAEFANIVTSRNPDDVPAFTEAVIALIEQAPARTAERATSDATA